MKFAEYVAESLRNPDLIETVPQRLFRIASGKSVAVPGYTFRSYPFFREGNIRIYGMSDVIHGLVGGFNRASVAYRRGQGTIFVVMGPPGSGKSELGKKLESMVIDDNDVNTRYTFSINGKPCPVSEDPINLLTSRVSFVPKDIRQKFYRGEYPQLCPNCVSNYNEVLSGEKREFSGQEEYCGFLDGIIKLAVLPPRFAEADITRPDFSKMVVRSARNSNRGILHIDINDRKLENIPDSSYQALLKLGDGKIIMPDGHSFNPDIVVLVYSNWESGNWKVKGREAFTDRVYPVEMSWNLSWRQELELYRSVSLPFTHVSAAALQGAAKFFVGSRIDFSSSAGYSTNSESGLDAILNHYSLYEEGNPALNDEDKQKTVQRIKGTRDGKVSDGLSIRQALKTLPGIRAGRADYSSSGESCLSPKSFIEWMESQRLSSATSSATSTVSRNEVKNQCISDVVLSLIYCLNEISCREELGKIDSLFEDYLDVYQNGFLKGRDYVVVSNRRVVPGEFLEGIEAKLGIAPDRKSDFREGINRFMDEQVFGPKRLPGFFEIISRNSSLVVSALNSSDYLPWSKLSTGDQLAPFEQERKDQVKSLMVGMLRYCGICAEDAISLAAEARAK